jgi:AcrR family transcriptional regulator
VTEGEAPRRARAGEARKERSRATRRRIVEAAFRLFSERGYAGTTMADIAAEAGVAVQTVYFTFNTKFALVREAFDYAVVGSDDGTSPNRQPWFGAVAEEPDLGRAIEILVDKITLISGRVAPMAEALRSLGDDPEAIAFNRDRERFRHEGFGEILELLATKRPIRPDLDWPGAVDIFFALLSPELYQALVLGRGWTQDRWRSWIAHTLEETLFSPR